VHSALSFVAARAASVVAKAAVALAPG
jgi:hypothetical protein